ncbi:short hypocotyl in white light1 [Raphanus sativus]|uniref:Protein SHORT HYPOCOTYL IN WHITE LIGHT 1 n=1 Tax=Raphanus sativus TaxID=3726 RepID=A0A6J0L5J6_RAPSA|nr:protein SHORT HYPOCOTYL IN WHITE LIGHT 1 [Raphanus sativus]KAJ4866468.1 short hypocotyl in white light1 [Raphanus sativus]
MALSATTLSSSSSLQLINVSHRFVSSTPFSIDSIILRRRLKRPLASQSRRRYDESEDRFFFDGYEYDVISDDDDDERESSVDLLVRFLTSMFRKVSKRAKKTSRRILPAAMSPRLVSFAVDGILLLGSLSITRAFLEVICNLGGTVFTVILLIRLFWTGASYFQNYGNSFGPNPF